MPRLGRPSPIPRRLPTSQGVVTEGVSNEDEGGLKAFGLTVLIGLSLAACGKKSSSSTTGATVKLKSATTVKGATTTAAKTSATTAKATTTATTAKGSATTTKGATTTAAKTTGSTGKGKVAASLPTVPAPATTLKRGSGPLATLKPVTTAREAVTIPPVTVADGKAPAKPDDRNCGDFANWAEAKQFYDTYYPYYGDLAHLDSDGDGIPCESLSGSPK